MAKKMKKLLSLILAISMIMSLLTVGASATEDGEGETAPASQAQIVKGLAGSAESTATNGDGVTVSKTITGTDDENVFDITLKVDTQKSIKEVYRKAQSTAVVIVMDISHTMKEQFGDSNRYDAAVAAAESFMKSYATAANPDGAEREVGFVAFNTDAHEVFGMSSCVTWDEADALAGTMKTVTGSRIGSDDFCGNGDGYCVRGGSPKCDYHNSSSKNYSGTSARFTNIEAGLAMGADMLAESDAVNKYIVFLSDGFPTTYMVEGTTDYAGYSPYSSSGTPGTPGVFYNRRTGEYCSGTSYSDEAATRAQNMAKSIKDAGTEIYSIGIDVDGQAISNYEETDKVMGNKSVIDCYSEDKGYVISDFKNWLEYSIGSGDEHYWDSTDADKLNAAFAEILANITDSVVTNSQASWVASDPMNAQNTTAIDFLQFYNKDGNLVSGNLTGPAASENTASFANDVINWDLKNSVCTETTSEDGNTTTYHYELKYRVRLANEAIGFVENEDVQTNGTTTLKYQYVETVNGKETLSEVKSVDFPIPEVEGYLGDFAFRKTDSEGNPLAGATFTLTHKSDCKVCGHLVNANLQFPESYTAVSAADGIVSFTGIPSGHSYELKETAAPTGYAGSYSATVSVDYGTVTVGGKATVTADALTPVVEGEGEDVVTTYPVPENGEFYAVVNSKLNSLTVTKSVVINTEGAAEDNILTNAGVFSFTVKDASGAVIEGGEFTLADGESKTFNNLPDGTYTVEEVDPSAPNSVNGYKVDVSGEDSVSLCNGSNETVTVTNTYTYVPNAKELTVTKVWNDDENRDGVRPASITVQLTIGGSVIDTKTLDAANGYSGKFVYDAVKHPGTPVVTEVGYTPVGGEYVAFDGEVTAVPGYAAPVVGEITWVENAGTVTVTNTHTVATTSFTVNKIWGSGTEGKEAPVTVRLYADGVEINSAVIGMVEEGSTAEPVWNHTFTSAADGTPLYVNSSNGTPIQYTLSEDSLGAHWTANVVFNGNGWTVTNSYYVYVPQYTTFTVNKVWVDNDDALELRPESVSVQLYANGNAYGEAVTLSEANGWSYQWTSLPMGVNYTVDEVSVPAGYVKSVSGGTITNTYEEEIPDENPPMSDWEEEEEFEEEDVPLADVPETGDMTALWAAASVISAAGILFLGKKNKDEE